MRAPDWLTARPVAHRGLHDISRGIVENMPRAVQAAVAGNFSIEVDIQLSADGEAMVHHDHALGRLTEASGELVARTAAELRALTFKDTTERMMSLSDLCALVAGRAVDGGVPSEQTGGSTFSVDDCWTSLGGMYSA